mmetsp:Transcript_29045/g.58520  ORF Transcript_29045/g.58520 Transcript_29045/m.58520 type:complete len:230 (-) Transcript_29045:119-808(-)
MTLGQLPVVRGFPYIPWPDRNYRGLKLICHHGFHTQRHSNTRRPPPSLPHSPAADASAPPSLKSSSGHAGQQTDGCGHVALYDHVTVWWLARVGLGLEGGGVDSLEDGGENTLPGVLHLCAVLELDRDEGAEHGTQLRRFLALHGGHLLFDPLPEQLRSLSCLLDLAAGLRDVGLRDSVLPGLRPRREGFVLLLEVSAERRVRRHRVRAHSQRLLCALHDAQPLVDNHE